MNNTEHLKISLQTDILLDDINIKKTVNEFKYPGSIIYPDEISPKEC